MLIPHGVEKPDNKKCGLGGSLEPGMILAGAGEKFSGGI
jgi:hypothetical protein